MSTVKSSCQVVCLCAVLASCAEEGKDPSGDPGTTDGASVRMSLKNTSAANMKRWPRAGGASIPGQSAPGDIQSLQYYIRSIDICQDMEITGSGYNGQSGCLNLYTATGQDDYDTYRENEARADTTNYIDLMDPVSRERLSKTVVLDESHIGTYQYGKVDWYMPIKLQATATLTDGSQTKLYTKDGTFRSEPCNNMTCYINEVSNMATPPAELAVLIMTNGGSWFKFQQPFEITQTDLDEKTVFALDLAFNPDKIIKAASGDLGPWDTYNNIYDPGIPAVISAPFLDLSPVFHRKDEKVAKETYVFHRTGDRTYDLRLELYGIADDPARAIYAADLKVLLIEGSTAGESSAPRISFIRAEGDMLVFEDYAHEPVIGGFQRLAEAGDAGTALLGCVNPAPDTDSDSGDSECGPDAVLPYELTAIVTLE